MIKYEPMVMEISFFYYGVQKIADGYMFTATVLYDPLCKYLHIRYPILRPNGPDTRGHDSIERSSYRNYVIDIRNDVETLVVGRTLSCIGDYFMVNDFQHLGFQDFLNNIRCYVLVKGDGRAIPINLAHESLVDYILQRIYEVYNVGRKFIDEIYYTKVINGDKFSGTLCCYGTNDSTSDPNQGYRGHLAFTIVGGERHTGRYYVTSYSNTRRLQSERIRIMEMVAKIISKSGWDDPFFKNIENESYIAMKIGKEELKGRISQ